MELRQDTTYHSDPATVFALLTDESFLEEVARGSGARSHDITVEREQDTVRTRLHLVMPPRGPDFVRAMVGDSVDVVQTTTWGPAAPDGSRSGVVGVEIARAPVRARGTVELTPTGGATRYALQGEVKASVPIVGRRIEQAAEQAVRHAFDAQDRLVRKRLAR